MAKAKSAKPAYWWQAPKGNAHREVFATARNICDQQARQRETWVDYMEMYANGNVAGLGITVDAPSSNKFQRYYHSKNGAPRFNIGAAVCDTVVSMVAYNPPIPQILTTGGDYGLIRTARKKTQVLQSQMHQIGEPVARRGFRDAAKLGIGFVWGEIDDDGQASLVRVGALELLVEHNDGLYGNPRSVHRVRCAVSKEELKDRHRGFDDEIDASGLDTARSKLARFTTTHKIDHNTCELIESIHLPVGDKPGRRTVCVSGGTLVDQPWTWPRFPLAVCRYRERDYGYYGAGLMESAYEAQLRIDALCDRQAKSQNLGSTMKMFNYNGPGTLKKSELTNEVGEVYDVSGPVPIQVVTFSGNLPDVQEQIELELRRLLFVEGVSESQAAGDGASRGLTSGVAIRAEEDSRASRMGQPLEMYQKFCLDLSKLIEHLNDRIAADNPEYAPTVRGRSGRRTFLSSSKWESLAIPPGQAQVDMFPMSSLPNSPSGRFAAVMEWIEGQFVDRNYGMQLLGFPDIDAYADVQLAYIDLVQYQIDQILDEKRILPFPRQDLIVAIDLGQRALAQLHTMENVPDTVLRSMNDYITYAMDLNAKGKGAQAAMMAAAAPPQPPQPVQGAGGAPNALAGQAPGMPDAAPPMLAGA